jgi:NAD+ synthase (glutamine-hydrolysing)
MSCDYFRVAAISPPVKVADVTFNLSKTKEFFGLAQEQNASLIVFPELGLTAYTCGDLFYDELLLSSAAEALLEFTLSTSGTEAIAIVGFPFSFQGNLYNCAAVVSNGQIRGLVPKSFLPNSGEFYEQRWFTSGRALPLQMIDFKGFTIPFGVSQIFSIKDSLAKFGVELCEDLWTINPPSGNLCAGGANIIVNLSASNELIGKAAYRRQLISQQSARGMCAYVYANAGPGESTTDLVFSGHCLIAENGTILGESSRFEFEGALLIRDIDMPRIDCERRRSANFAVDNLPFLNETVLSSASSNLKSDLFRVISQYPFVPSDNLDRDSVCAETFAIQTAGLRKRLEHTGVQGLVLGLSGGLDSTLALLIALHVFDQMRIERKNINCLSMPGFGTSSRTKENAKQLALVSGTSFKEIDIRESVSLHLLDISHSKNEKDITFENSQARERTQILMDVANQKNSLVLGTGDLSEAALGWCTYNGDHMSMYHVNSGVPKTLIQFLLRWHAETSEVPIFKNILFDVLDTPISPELLPVKANGEIQLTEQTIGPYVLHDFFLYHLFRGGCRPKKIVFMAEIAFSGVYNRDEIKKWLLVFYRRFFSQQFKRSAMPDGPKIGSVALSPRGDWRMPSDASPDIWIRELESLS